jgi:hypothetical protein
MSKVLKWLIFQNYFLDLIFTSFLLGPTLKAVVKLIGHCGLPNVVMEKSGVSCNVKDVG